MVFFLKLGGFFSRLISFQDQFLFKIDFFLRSDGLLFKIRWISFKVDFFSITGCFLFKFEPFKVDFLLRSNRSRLRGKFTVEDRRLINNWLMYSSQNIKCFKIYRNIQNNIRTKLLHLPKKKTRTKIHPPKRCFTSLLVGHSRVVLLLARGIQSQSLFPTNKYSSWIFHNWVFNWNFKVFYILEQYQKNY